MALSPHSIKVTWGLPDSNADDVTRYTISYNSQDVDGGTRTRSASSSSSSATIDRLEEFISYDIRVQAVYRGGTGPFSDSVEVKTLSDGK